MNLCISARKEYVSPRVKSVGSTSLKAPIVPFYIQIPAHINPGCGIDAEPGTVHIYFEDPIQTADWKLEDLVENKEKVRNLFLAYQQKYSSV